MKKIAFWALLCLVFVACRKDFDSDQLVVQNYEPPVIEINVEASIEGVILDETGAPVSDAVVRLGGLSTVSDEEGLFVFRNVMMDRSGTYLQAEKDGYFHGSTRFFPKDQSKNYATITLMDRQIIGQLKASTGGSLIGPNNIELFFPPNSIVDAYNQPYTSLFSVAARWLNPEAENLFEIMPGNLQGINTDDNEVALISFGMMAVELLDLWENPLQLGNNQKATLTFPLPETYRSQAADEIPLWYFNENSGLWEEEGQAFLQGDTYVGEVAHFSFWNCDVPYRFVQLSGTILANTPEGELIPIPNALVKVKTSELGCSYGNTDQDGYFSGAVPIGVPLELVIKDDKNCNAIIHTMTIDALSADKDLGEIIVTLPQIEYIEITGSLLDCNNQPLTDGWIQVEIGGRKISHYVDATTFKLTVFNCDSSSELNIIGRNFNTAEEGSPQTFLATSEINTGDIIVCGNGLSNVVRYFISGEERVYPAVAKTLAPKQFIIETTGGSLGLRITFFFNSSPVGPGTFGQSNIWAIELIDEFDFTSGETVESDCSGLDLFCVNFTEFNLTEYTGLIGENIKGNFNGTISVKKPVGSTPDSYNNRPFSGDFSVELTE